MPLISAYSAGDLSTIRGNIESANGYVAIHAPSVIVQFNPSASNTAREAASITYSAVLSGDGTDTLLGMTVIISPSSDWEGDLRDHRDQCLVSYVRSVGSGASSGTLGIGKTAYQWTTSDFVTVIDDFRVFKREIRIVGTTIYHDWDRAYTTPLPRIYNLEADVVVISGASTNYSPTPTAAAMVVSGTISSYSWSKIESGSVTKAVSTSQNPTISLALGWNWLHLTVTDSEGNTNYLVVPVLVVDTNFSQAVILRDASSLSVTRSLNNGNSAQFTAIASADSLTPGTNVLVVNQLDYLDGTSETTIACYGWLADVNASTRGDLNAGVIKEGQFEVRGIAQKMGEYKIAARYVDERTTPTDWPMLARVTMFDVSWLALSEYSTIPNVAAISIGNTYTDYRFSEVNIPEGDFLSIVNGLMARGQAIAMFTPEGMIYFDTSLLYETSDANRNAATVIATFGVQDGSLAAPQIPDGQPVEQVELGAGVYVGTNSTPRIFRALAPGDFTAGALREQVDGMLLVAGTSVVNSLIAVGQLAANHWSASNASPVLHLTALPGYHGVIPVAHQWYKFNFADFASGHIFDTNDRFLLLEVSLEYRLPTGEIVPTLTLRKETNGGNKYARFAEYITIGTKTLAEPVPPSLYPGIATADDIYSNAPCYQAVDLPPEVAERLRDCIAGGEILFTPFHALSAATMTGTTVAAETYVLEIEGYSTEQAASTFEQDFDGGGASYSTSFHNTAGSPDPTVTDTGSGNPGNGLEGALVGPFPAGTISTRYVQIEFDLGASYEITNITFDMFSTQNGSGLVYFFLDGVQVVWSSPLDSAMWDAIDLSTSTHPSNAFPVTGQVVDLRLVWNYSKGGAGTDLISLDNIVITVSGGGTNNTIDAFYSFDPTTGVATQHASGDGLQLNGGDITSIPAFNNSHSYSVEETGDGASWNVRYDDSDYSNNAEGWLKVAIIGQGLGS